MQIKTNPGNLENYKTYLQIEDLVHRFFKSRKYLRLDLPVLSPALIPESYLEIFETEFSYLGRKEKLYLTPSPELFMKRLLTEKIGNCYYLGKCFRNGEPDSPWHNPEFTMLEFYRVGVNYLGLADEVLQLLGYIDKNLKNRSSKTTKYDKWEKITVAEAFTKFAGIAKQELLDEKLFMRIAAGKKYDTDGYGYEDLFSQILATEIEPKLGINGYPTLLYDYPKKMASLAKLSKDGNIAERCEFYINGLEIGGFCTELNDYKEQEKRFISESRIRKDRIMKSHPIDKGFIESLKYGLPEVTGAGIGFDRLAMMMTGTTTIDSMKLISIG